MIAITSNQYLLEQFQATRSMQKGLLDKEAIQQGRPSSQRVRRHERQKPTAEGSKPSSTQIEKGVRLSVE